jgi:dihydrofolate reductase
MRKVIVGAFLSLDGVMQSPGGPQEDTEGGFDLGGWFAPHIDEIFGEEVDKLFVPPFDLLLGRKTYDIFAAHWPHVDDGEDASIAALFSRATKYVASRSLSDPAWAESVVLRDAGKEVAQLKQAEGPTLVTQGSSDLMQTLLAHDLIDEIRLFTVPILLGQGKRLFGEGTIPAAFRLRESRITGTGVIVANYERAGKVQTGDLSLDPA